MKLIDELRTYRVYNIAIFDLLLTFAAAYFIAQLLNFPVEQAFLLVIPISILVHTIFGKETTLTKMFFDRERFIPFKILIAFLLFKGLYYEPLFVWDVETATSSSTTTTPNNTPPSSPLSGGGSGGCSGGAGTPRSTNSSYTSASNEYYSNSYFRNPNELFAT